MNKYLFLILVLSYFQIINKAFAQENFNSETDNSAITFKNDSQFFNTNELPEPINYSSALINSVRDRDTVKATENDVEDLGDVMKRLFKKKDAKPKKKKEKKLYLLLLPNISYNPVNGLLLGISATAAGKMKGDETRMSLVGATAAVTTEKQFVSFVKSSIYTNNNNFFLEGDWRFYKFSAPTFGLGTNSPDRPFDFHVGLPGGGDNENNGGYQMKYNYVIFHQIVNKKIKENLYAGIGYQLDTYWDIIDEDLNLDTIPKQITPHYAYSIKHGFDPSQYTISGLSINGMYDSRDNQISAYRGIYARVNYRYNPKFLGSTKASSDLWVEFRTYVGLSKRTESHVLAFWVFGSFQTSGTKPYLTLMSTAGDKRTRSGRGYIAGRFRGEDMMYGEVEWRFPIMPKKKTVAGVVFLNGVTTSNRGTGEGLFDYVKPAIGFGIRVLVNKHTRLNIDLDFGMGIKSNGGYFAAGEAF